MLIAGHPVYHPPDTVQPFGKVTGPGMQRDAPQLFQREVDTADDRPFPVRCQVRAVLPEVVAENLQRVSGAEEQPDTFSEGRFPEVGRAPADDVETVGVHELQQRVTVRENVPQCPHQCPPADSAAAHVDGFFRGKWFVGCHICLQFTVLLVFLRHVSVWKKVVFSFCRYRPPPGYPPDSPACVISCRHTSFPTVASLSGPPPLPTGRRRSSWKSPGVPPSSPREESPDGAPFPWIAFRVLFPRGRTPSCSGTAPPTPGGRIPFLRCPAGS